VNLQINSIFNLNEKSQQLSADFALISTWTDPGLIDPKKPASTVTDSTPIDRGQMWSPRLTFTNRRDLINPNETVLNVTNKGAVTFIQRYIAAYAVSLNIRDFPFDTQVRLDACMQRLDVRMNAFTASGAKITKTGVEGRRPRALDAQICKLDIRNDKRMLL
jgi:hypothetical protein